MASTPEGRTAFLLEDFMDPDAILAGPQLREALDLGEPVGLLLVAMLMYFDPAEGQPEECLLLGRHGPEGVSSGQFESP